MVDNTPISWNGKPLEECSREELVGLVRHQYRKLIKFNEIIMKRGKAMRKAAALLEEPDCD